MSTPPDLNLGWLQKYVWRNPLTGHSIVEVDRLQNSAEFRKLLASVWDAGYSSGLSDGMYDSTVEESGVNPYK